MRGKQTARKNTTHLQDLLQTKSKRATKTEQVEEDEPKERRPRGEKKPKEDLGPPPLTRSAKQRADQGKTVDEKKMIEE